METCTGEKPMKSNSTHLKKPQAQKNKPTHYQRLWSYALFLFILFCIASLFGFQAHVSVIAGVHSGHFIDQSCGLIYLILYVCTLSLVPILILSGVILWISTQLSQHTSQSVKVFFSDSKQK